jgi:transketolase
MRNAFANAFYELAKKDERIMLVVADITASAGVATFMKEHPERFINVGVAEQAMISISAGLALRGMIPFTYTIAPFTIYRPFEQVRVDCCYHHLPVRLVGVGAGVTYSTLGGTHHALEDLSVMGGIPGLTIYAPCDPAETAALTLASAKVAGPLYLRLGKVGEPDLTKEAPEPLVPGKIRALKPGRDLAIVTLGPIARLAFEVARGLKEGGRADPAIFGIHCPKPLDRAGLLEKVLQRFPRILLLEEHVPHGGISSRVKEVAAEEGTGNRFATCTLQDEFIHVYGSHDDVLRAHGLDVATIRKKAEAL